MQWWMKMNAITRIKRKSPRRRGTVLPLVAACLVVLLGFVVLAVDVGYLYVAASEAQTTADSGALAGASVLNDPVPAAVLETHATEAAQDLVVMNPVLRENVVDDAVIEVGHWEGTTQTFTAGDAGRAIRPNAVRVVAFRNEIRLFFAPVMGVHTSDVHREAVATVGSGKCLGIWGIEGITTDGGITTDSFDSTRGPYGAGSINPNGDLCSCQDIVLNGAFEINGDVMHGRGYEHIDHGNSGNVWGVIAEHVCGTIETEADFALAELNNDNASIGLTANGNDPFKSDTGWDLHLTSDDSITLTGGTYFFDSVRLAGQATIRVTGPSVIYVNGNADFTGGGIVNVTADPANLLIYSAGSTMDVKGEAGFYGAIFAPDTDVKVTGTSDYFGTLVSATLKISGDTDIHVDESIVQDLFKLEPVHPVLVR
jgi:hypothetical protein